MVERAPEKTARMTYQQNQAELAFEERLQTGYVYAWTLVMDFKVGIWVIGVPHFLHATSQTSE